MDNSQLYDKAEMLLQQIEAELKALNRWRYYPLPKEKFENM